MNVERETDIEMLRRKARLALAENARLAEEIVRVKRENLELRGATPEQLQQELALLDEKLRRDAEALEAAALALEQERRETPRTQGRTRSRSGPREEQKTLPIEEVVHDLDDADKQCPACGGSLSHFGDDVTEEVDVIERRFVIKKHVRRKYGCKCGSCVETADIPARLVPGGRYSNAFALEVVAMKYIDQLPLERIVRVFRREGLVVDSQTLWDQSHALSKKLQPAWERLRETILDDDVIGIDQSPWKVLGHKKSWQMWTLSTSALAYFEICGSKGAEDGARVLGEYRGIAVGDAATTHDALASTLPIRFAHCWAHPRREAEKLKASDPVRADALIGFIRELYDVEDDAGDDVDKRRLLRGTRSRDVLRRLFEWRREQRPLPSSPTAKLLNYLDNHRVGLERFIDDPRISIDNNQSERGYLWVAVGRRSFFGSRSQQGTRAAAIFYSLAESARRCGLDPKKYLALALDDALAGRVIRLPNEVRE